MSDKASRLTVGDNLPPHLQLIHFESNGLLESRKGFSPLEILAADYGYWMEQEITAGGLDVVVRNYLPRNPNQVQPQSIILGVEHPANYLPDSMSVVYKARFVSTRGERALTLRLNCDALPSIDDDEERIVRNFSFAFAEYDGVMADHLDSRRPYDEEILNRFRRTVGYLMSIIPGEYQPAEIEDLDSGED